MNKTTEQRLSDLERRLALMEKAPAARRRKQAWRASVGWASGDKLYDEALKLGAEYRQAQR